MPAGSLWLLPAPIFWGALASWIPLSPGVMAGLFIAVVVYAFLRFLAGLDAWNDADGEYL